MRLPRSSSRWLDWLGYKKSVGICILPSYALGLLALPYLCRMATQSPRLICNIRHTAALAVRQSGGILHSTGIYRCLILDISVKFCENFRASRISVINAFCQNVPASLAAGRLLHTHLAYPRPRLCGVRSAMQI